MTPHPAEPTRRVLGVVVAPEPGSLGAQQLHGARLVDHVLRALSEVADCDVVLVGGSSPHRGRSASSGLALSRLASGYDVVLVHDPLCPLVPVSAMTACLDSVGPDGTALGVLPVTDTVKRVDGDIITATVDRDALRVLAAPVAFPVSLVPALEQELPCAGDLDDLARLVEVLGGLGPLRSVRVPSFAQRVCDIGDVAVLECLHDLRHTLRER